MRNKTSIFRPKSKIHPRGQAKLQRAGWEELLSEEEATRVSCTDARPEGCPVGRVLDWWEGGIYRQGTISFSPVLGPRARLAGAQGDSWCGDVDMPAGTTAQLWSLSRNNNSNDNNSWRVYHEPDTT